MVKASWRHCLLEDAFFTLRIEGKLVAMALTRVFDMLLARLRDLDSW